MADYTSKDLVDTALDPIYDGLKWATAYACRIVESDRNQKAELRAGGIGQARYWLNGSPLFDQSQTRAPTNNPNVVPVELKKGANYLLVKVCGESESWAFALRLTAPGGAPLYGVGF